MLTSPSSSALVKSSTPLRQSPSVSRNLLLGLSVGLVLADMVALLVGFLVGSTVTPITGTPVEVAAAGNAGEFGPAEMR